ncbi:MAG: hypothetical protein RLZZ417_2349 [Bacteroidota bacterium]|jgi:hypothetical protein
MHKIEIPFLILQAIKSILYAIPGWFIFYLAILIM